MTIAIIGVGNIGSRLAVNLHRGGRSLILSAKNLDNAQGLASTLGNNVVVMPVDAAIERAEVVVLAVYFDAIKELIAQNEEALSGKIVVDPSNPIAPDGKGGFTKTIPADQSSGQSISGLLPRGAKLVKAFGTLSAESLESGADRSPERAALFYATDHAAAGEVVADLIAASGFSPVFVGGIAASIRIEVGGDLHEFGKLGKLVSADEGRKLL